MYISEETVERVKEAIDLAALVGEYVDLKPSGRSLKACCPFHQEKTPSFHVTPELGIFKCFGCGESGDGISFVMKMEHMDFPTAVRFLADKYGIPIESEHPEDLEKKKRRALLLDINRKAAYFYYRKLLTDRRPQDYLKGRGMRSTIINPFLLGYADGKGDSLYRYLKEEGYEEADLFHLGLIAKSNSGRGFYDKFRNRLIFPILSKQKEVVGFGGRVLGQGQPKYLNSPESTLFHKGDHLYGLHIVAERPRRDRLLMVEGYMDVIGLYAQGIDYALASLGTALTPNQARLMGRYSQNIYLCYDGDSAGIKAARRAIGVLKEEGLRAKMILLPDEMDPDEFIRARGRAAFEEQIEAALDPPAFELRLIVAGYDLSQASGRLDFLREAIPYLARLDQEAEREIYLQEVARLADVRPEGLAKDLKGALAQAQLEKEAREKHRMQAGKSFEPRETPYVPDYYDAAPEAPSYYSPPVEPETRASGQAPQDGLSHQGYRKELRLIRRRRSLERAVLIRLKQGAVEASHEAIFLHYLGPDTRPIGQMIKALRDQGLPVSANGLRERMGEKLEDSFYQLFTRLEQESAPDRTQLILQEQELAERIRQSELEEKKEELQTLLKQTDADLTRSGFDRNALYQQLAALDRKLEEGEEGDR